MIGFAEKSVTAGSPRTTVSYDIGHGYGATNLVVLREPAVPASFYRALEDLKADRIVEIENAHSEVPPFNLG